LNATTFSSSAIFGHAAVVSVSQDSTNWFSFTNMSVLFPANAYRWDDANDSWSNEQMNPTKPFNPFLYTNDFTGESVATALDQFTGAVGGSSFDLKASRLPWIQFVRVQPASGTYTVIDAIAAVNPAVVGDALSIAPDNLVNSITNLVFQNPSNPGENLITIDFDAVNYPAKISTVSLGKFSAFAPVPGNVSSACQITARPLVGNSAVTYVADVGLRTGESYSGNGHDLRVYQWLGTNWTSRPFTFNPATFEVLVSGVTQFSAFVVAQIVPPQLTIQTTTNGWSFQFVPVANCPNILERSLDFITWTPIATNTPLNSQSIALLDTNAPAGKAFYRVLLNVP
jgi:hypothetical protein